MWGSHGENDLLKIPAEQLQGPLDLIAIPPGAFRNEAESSRETSTLDVAACDPLKSRELDTCWSNRQRNGAFLLITKQE
jgi:uncharacterized RmlC-like cupin family protein